MSDITGHRVGIVGIEGELAARVREETARHWKLLLTIGILSDITGVFSIFVPIVASISVSVLVGWVLLVAGIVELGHGLRHDLAWSWSKAGELLVAVLTIVAGGWILLFPLDGAITLTVVLVVWFWTIGVARLLVWWRMRGIKRSWTVALNGVLSLALGILIWADLPSSAEWAIGLLVGVELLFAGSALIMAALDGRQLARSGTA